MWKERLDGYQEKRKIDLSNRDKAIINEATICKYNDFQSK